MIWSGPSSPIPSRPVRIRSMYDGHQRPHVGVDDGGRGALVLALLAQDLARERDVHLGQLLGEDRAEAPLVLGVEVGVQEADGDGVTPVARRRAASARLSSSSSCADDGAVRGDALVQLEAEVALDERRRLAPEEVVHVRDPQPAQLEHVAEAGGRDERRRAAAPLEHGVRRHRRAVDDLGDCPAARAGREAADRLDDRPVVARRRREQLAEDDAAVGAVEDHVGEGAADVDAHPCRGGHSGRSRRSARCWP